MTESRVAARYAKSLLDQAQETGALARTEQDMRDFHQTLQGSRELQLLLQSPVVKSDKKMAVLRRLFDGKLSALTMRFFEILSGKSREAELVGVASAFMSQLRILQGVQQATVTTALPLTDELREQVRQLAEKQTGKKIELTEQVDASLIGGFVLRLGDRQIDSSVASRLQKLRTSFADTSYVSKL